MPLGLILFVGYYVFVRRRRGKLFGDELQALGEPTRYALAAAALDGSPFRRRVILMANHPFRAQAPELGLDFPLVLAACERWERQDRSLNWTLTALLGYVALELTVLLPLMFAVFGYGRPTLTIALYMQRAVPFAILGILVAVIVRAVRDERRLRSLRRNVYDPAQMRESFGLKGPPGTVAGLRENVVCYGTRDPFIGLGQRVAGWQVAVETDRGAESLSASLRGNGHVQPSPVDLGILLGAIDRSVAALAIPNLSQTFPLFVSGTEVAQLGAPLLRDPYARPATVADGDVLGRYWYLTDPRARAYRCYMITDWNGELVFSYLVRFVQRGQSLGIETSQLVLAPVDPRYRQIDTLRRRGLVGWLLWIVGVVARIPVTLWSAVLGTFGHIGELLGLSGFSPAEERREVRRNPAYNYGARTTVRGSLAAGYYNAHFQFIDGRQYFKAIDQRVLNAIVDELARSGIDVTSLVGQAQMIVNGSVNLTDNSVSVANSSGSFNFGTVGAGAAFGAGAQAAGAPAAKVGGV